MGWSTNMNHLSVLVLACTLFATNVLASDLNYTLEVKGMVCAYCAYNVSKQLKSLDGVFAPFSHSAMPRTMQIPIDWAR